MVKSELVNCHFQASRCEVEEAGQESHTENKVKKTPY